MAIYPGQSVSDIRAVWFGDLTSLLHLLSVDLPRLPDSISAITQTRMTARVPNDMKMKVIRGVRSPVLGDPDDGLFCGSSGTFSLISMLSRDGSL